MMTTPLGITAGLCLLLPLSLLAAPLPGHDSKTDQLEVTEQEAGDDTGEDASAEHSPTPVPESEQNPAPDIGYDPLEGPAVLLEPGILLAGYVNYDSDRPEHPLKWYRFDPEVDGMVVINVQGDKGDLVIEAYRNAIFGSYLARADNTGNGEEACETMRLLVKAGDHYPIKICPFARYRGVHIEGSSDINFVVSAEFIPAEPSE